MAEHAFVPEIAHGTVKAQDLLDMNVPQLKVNVPALNLHHSLDALAAGKRVIYHNIEFHWTRTKGAWYKLPNVTTIYHVVKGYCPYPTSERDDVMHAYYGSIHAGRISPGRRRLGPSQDQRQ